MCEEKQELLQKRKAGRTVLGLLRRLKKDSRKKMSFYLLLCGALLFAAMTLIVTCFVTIPRIEDGKWLTILLAANGAAVTALAGVAQYMHKCSLVHAKDYEQATRDIAKLVLLWQNRDAYNVMDFTTKVTDIVERKPPDQTPNRGQ